MLLIVGCHFSVHGVFQALWKWMPDYGLWQSATESERLFLSFLSAGGAIGNGLFFTLSGFFMVKQSPGVFKLARFIFQLVFYAVIATVVYFVVKNIGLYSFPELQSQKEHIPSAPRLLLGCFLPVTMSSWWFASVYFWLCLLSPALNRLVLALNRTGMAVLLTVTFFLWFVPSLFEFDYSLIQRGVFFYLVGTFCRLHGFFLKRGSALLASLFFYSLYSAYIFFSGGMFAEALRTLGLEFSFDLCGWAICPFAIYSIFSLFSTFNFQNHVVNLLARTTFGVYLLHECDVGRALIWNVIVRPLGHIGKVGFVLFALLSILVVFCACSVVDLVRIFLIERPLLPRLHALYEKGKQRFSHKEE